MSCSTSLVRVSWRSPIYGPSGTRRKKDFPASRPFSLPHRATNAHALSPSLQPSLPGSPKPPDRPLGLFPAGALSQGSASRSSIEVLSAEAAGQKAEGPGGSEGASSSPAASEVGSHSDGGESSSGTSGFTRVFDSDAAGSDSSSPESGRAKNEVGMPSGLLSNAELAALPPTTVPRSEWLPGYRDRRSCRSHDIVSWSTQDIRQTSIVAMDGNLLFHRFTKPMEW
ncbi:hypothetical protein F444_22444 [Phytophthora nicotianae P1976]|uniref:Uncharacterized protein n=1 Tax=Phytophthora nicotianae P1976 TaxID=1317066 RepID=A0A080YXS3_PHYNI|nr:hypothetical protein F444_22444 [Phytophthora nicotianae P1976]